MDYSCGISTGEKDAEKEEEKELPSLDKFLAKNTSEDNASFEQIMELAKDKEKLRHSWLYEAEEEFKQVCTPSPKSHNALIYIAKTPQLPYLEE